MDAGGCFVVKRYNKIVKTDFLVEYDVPVILRCRERGCSVRARRDDGIRDSWTESSRYGVKRKSRVFLGYKVFCPEHNCSMVPEGLQAEYNPSVHCGAVCWFAVGKVCVCSCGGAKHGGAGFMVGT